MEPTKNHSLLNKLFGIINALNEDDSKVIIAKYLLTHLQDIKHINIYDISEACNIDRTNIRRFCQSIGYENFRDFKMNATKEHSVINEFSDYETWEPMFTRIPQSCLSHFKQIKKYRR